MMEPFSQTIIVPQDGQFIMTWTVAISVNISCHCWRVICLFGLYSFISVPQNEHR
jgi:hypothetical protein